MFDLGCFCTRDNYENNLDMYHIMYHNVIKHVFAIVKMEIHTERCDTTQLSYSIPLILDTSSDMITK